MGRVGPGRPVGAMGTGGGVQRAAEMASSEADVYRAPVSPRWDGVASGPTGPSRVVLAAPRAQRWSPGRRRHARGALGLAEWGWVRGRVPEPGLGPALCRGGRWRCDGPLSSGTLGGMGGTGRSHRHLATD